MAPLVSVLMPVRDGATYLDQALESIQSQTLSDFELIVVDDGSRDASPEIVASRAAGDPRVRLIRRSKTGIVGSLEAARGLARAPLLARMDADDIALPRRLEHQVARLARGDIDVCGGQVELFPRSQVRDGMRVYEGWLNHLTVVERAALDTYVECPIAHPTLLARREAVAAAGGWRTRAWPEDYDLILRLHRSGVSYCSVEMPVLRWRDHDRRLSRTHERYTQEAFVRCKVHHLRAQFLQPGRSVALYGCGPVGKRFAREFQRQGVEISAFLEVDERKIGKRVYGVPVRPMGMAVEFLASFGVGAVAGSRARADIRAAAADIGRRDGVDFVAVA